jgi:cytochrome o ubiquinol oxidase subunit I
VRGYQRPTQGFRAILMPKNTPSGIFLAGLAAVFGVAMIWYVWWLAALSFVGLVVTAIHHTFNYDREFHIPVEDITSAEDGRTRLLASAGV